MATQLLTASRSVATARWCVVCVRSPSCAALCPVLTWPPPCRSQYIHLNATLTRDNADLARQLADALDELAQLKEAFLAEEGGEAGSDEGSDEGSREDKDEEIEDDEVLVLPSPYPTPPHLNSSSSSF